MLRVVGEIKNGTNHNEEIHYICKYCIGKILIIQIVFIVHLGNLGLVLYNIAAPESVIYFSLCLVTCHLYALLWKNSFYVFRDPSSTQLIYE